MFPLTKRNTLYHLNSKLIIQVANASGFLWRRAHFTICAWLYRIVFFVQYGAWSSFHLSLQSPRNCSSQKWKCKMIGVSSAFHCQLHQMRSLRKPLLRVQDGAVPGSNAQPYWTVVCAQWLGRLEQINLNISNANKDAVTAEPLLGNVSPYCVFPPEDGRMTECKEFVATTAIPSPYYSKTRGAVKQLTRSPHYWCTVQSAYQRWMIYIPGK
jgi:hypothetical protein